MTLNSGYLHVIAMITGTCNQWEEHTHQNDTFRNTRMIRVRSPAGFVCSARAMSSMSRSHPRRATNITHSSSSMSHGSSAPCLACWAPGAREELGLVWYLRLHPHSPYSAASESAATPTVTRWEGLREGFFEPGDIFRVKSREGIVSCADSANVVHGKICPRHVRFRGKRKKRSR